MRRTPSTPHRPGRATRWTVLVVCAGLVAGCGTTVPLSELGQANPGTGGLARAGAAGSSGAGGPGNSGGPGAASLESPGASAGPAAGVAAAAAGGPNLSPGAPGPSAPASGAASLSPGRSDSGGGAGARPAAGGPIPVAFFYLNGGNQVLSSAFPGSSVSFGNGQKEAQAVVDDVNHHGGVDGRPLAPSYVAIQATGTSDADLQQACLGAVQDDHPLAILSIFNLSPGLASCAQQTRTLFIDVALGAGDDGLYQSAQNYVFTPSQLSRNAEQTLVLGLAHQEGRLPTGAKIGILSEDDDPMYDRVVTSTIEPLLKSWNISALKEDFNPSSYASDISSAVLRFKTDGVSTVVFSVGSGGIAETLFMQDAQQQQFFPRYLMGDSTDPSFVASAAPRSEAQNMWGAGTMPLADVTASQYPTTPNEKHCLDVMNSSFGAGYSNRGSSLTATLYCEMTYSFTDVARAVQGPLTAASWVAEYRQFGSGYSPVTTFATTFGRDNYGADAYRELDWNNGCSCVAYTTPVRPIP